MTESALKRSLAPLLKHDNRANRCAVTKLAGAKAPAGLSRGSMPLRAARRVDCRAMGQFWVNQYESADCASTEPLRSVNQNLHQKHAGEARGQVRRAMQLPAGGQRPLCARLSACRQRAATGQGLLDACATVVRAASQSPRIHIEYSSYSPDGVWSGSS